MSRAAAAASSLLTKLNAELIQLFNDQSIGSDRRYLLLQFSLKFLKKPLRAFFCYSSYFTSIPLIYLSLSRLLILSVHKKAPPCSDASHPSSPASPGKQNICWSCSKRRHATFLPFLFWHPKIQFLCTWCSTIWCAYMEIP